MVLGNLVLRLLVAVRDHAVEEAAGLALRVALLLRLLDLTAKVARGLVVDFFVVLGFVEVGWGILVLRDVEGWEMRARRRWFLRFLSCMDSLRFSFSRMLCIVAGGGAQERDWLLCSMCLLP